MNIVSLSLSLRIMIHIFLSALLRTVVPAVEFYLPRHAISTEELMGVWYSHTRILRSSLAAHG